MSAEPLTLGAWIKAQRKQRGWVQKELARRSGLRQNYISMLENDDIQEPTVPTLRGIAEAFNVSLESLMALVPVSLPNDLDLLRSEGLPQEIIDELASKWPVLLPEDRRAVLEHTRALWERRVRGRSDERPNTQVAH